VSSFLRGYDPFASCVSDAAVLFAVSECGDEWWRENVWGDVILPAGSSCTSWSGDLLATTEITGPVSSHPTVELKIPGFSSSVFVKARRLVWAWAFGFETLPDGKQVDFSTDEVVVMTCWNHLCLSAAHMEKVSRTELGFRTWAREIEQVGG
jgi:hypothetical protein